MKKCTHPCGTEKCKDQGKCDALYYENGVAQPCSLYIEQQPLCQCGHPVSEHNSDGCRIKVCYCKLSDAKVEVHAKVLRWDREAADLQPPAKQQEKHCTNPNIGCVNGNKECGCKTNGYITSDLPGGNGTCDCWQPKEQPAKAEPTKVEIIYEKVPIEKNRRIMHRATIIGELEDGTVYLSENKNVITISYKGNYYHANITDIISAILREN